MTIFIDKVDNQTVTLATRVLQNGGVISFPTETVYALAADSQNDAAINQIYKIKGRSPTKPLALLASNIAQIEEVAALDSRAYKLLEKYSPGPITLILPIKETATISTAINYGSRTIGIRIPDHSLSLDIISSVGHPIIGTSANISGHEASLNAYEVKSIFPNDLDLIIYQDTAMSGISSTVIDLCSDTISFLRIGSIPAEEILSTLKRT